MSEGILLSVVIPFYNEREVLPECLKRVGTVLAGLDGKSEILFVDDGSRDGGGDFLLTQHLPGIHIRLIRLSRNFGKEAAMTAGIEHARGDALAVLDADLQDPPELIPDMLAKWRQGHDVVLMKRRSRAGESLFKRWSAHVFYRLLKRACGFHVPEDVGDFRLLSRKAIDSLKCLGESNRYMKGLFAWVGLPVTVILYDRAPRHAGCSKWNYLSLLRLAWDGVTSFTTLPLRLSMMAGVMAALLGSLFGAWIVVKALFLGDPVQGYPSLMAVITFLGGVQLMALGIVGEYVGKTYMESKRRPVYVIDFQTQTGGAEVRGRP